MEKTPEQILEELSHLLIDIRPDDDWIMGAIKAEFAFRTVTLSSYFEMKDGRQESVLVGGYKVSKLLLELKDLINQDENEWKTTLFTLEVDGEINFKIEYEEPLIEET